MEREELERKFDEALAHAHDTNRWTAGGMQAWAHIALAIAVRGLWPEEKQQSAPAVYERDFGPPVNQGGG